jgi:hypothetical protein
LHARREGATLRPDERVFPPCAHGSNLDHARLAARCTGAIPLGPWRIMREQPGAVIPIGRTLSMDDRT